MFLKTKIAAAVLACSIFAVQPFAQNKPFPQAGKFQKNGINPTNRTQDQMNKDVQARFDAYKNKYLKSINANDGSGVRYWINASGTGSSQTATISEAHGYGMIIFALMAGYDRDAKIIFDGMNRLRKAHKSNKNGNLMAWEVFNPEQNSIGSGAATDGDLDNAYALLLAHAQWGDASYLNDAQTLIGAIRQDLMYSDGRTKLGDWNTSGTTRSSDWMAGHFRAFAKATSVSFWNTAADKVYSVLGQSANSTTGLMPDFVTSSGQPDPNCGGNTGEHNCADYSYNACRTPWRLALDYVHNGTSSAETHLKKMTDWLRGKTGGSPNQIMAGYRLNGTQLNDYNDMAFTAPFASAMLANPSSASKDFLNGTYSNIISTSPQDEYAAAIQLLNMLLISGNWWAPNSNGIVDCPECDPVTVIADYTEAEWSDNGNGSQNCDGYGSWSSIDNNDTENGVLEFRMNVAAMNSADEVYPWASIGTYFDAGDFPEEATKFEITYTSSASLKLSFLEPEIAEGYVRSFTLDPQSGEKTVTVDISGFQYPDWGEDYPKPALDKSKISGIMIEAIPLEGEQHSVTAKITGLKITSGGATPIAPKTSGAQNKKIRSGVSIAGKNVSFNIPSEKAISVRICDIRGRQLFSKNITLNSGVASFALPANLMANQTLILNVKGQNGLNMSKKMLVK